MFSTTFELSNITKEIMIHLLFKAKFIFLFYSGIISERRNLKVSCVYLLCIYDIFERIWQILGISYPVDNVGLSLVYTENIFGLSWPYFWNIL